MDLQITSKSASSIRMHAGSTDISPADSAAPTLYSCIRGKPDRDRNPWNLMMFRTCGNLIHRNTCCTAVQCDDSGTAAAVLTGILLFFSSCLCFVSALLLAHLQGSVFSVSAHLRRFISARDWGVVNSVCFFINPFCIRQVIVVPSVYVPFVGQSSAIVCVNSKITICTIYDRLCIGCIIIPVVWR